MTTPSHVVIAASVPAAPSGIDVPRRFAADGRHCIAEVFRVHRSNRPRTVVGQQKDPVDCPRPGRVPPPTAGTERSRGTPSHSGSAKTAIPQRQTRNSPGATWIGAVSNVPQVLAPCDRAVDEIVGPQRLRVPSGQARQEGPARYRRDEKPERNVQGGFSSSILARASGAMPVESSEPSGASGNWIAS